MSQWTAATSPEGAFSESTSDDRAETFVLVDETADPAAAHLFAGPRDIVECRAPEDLPSALAALERALAQGFAVAGFIGYEAGYVFEPRLAPLMPPERSAPLVWMGVFDHWQRLDARGLRDFLLPRVRAGHRLGALRPALGRDAYIAQVERIRALIAAGDIYQANFTFPVRFDLTGDPLSLYLAVRARQPVAHGGLIAAPGFHALSWSPELFIGSDDGRQATTRPMKGTAPRGADPANDPAADQTAASGLQADEKSRAENLMIVDLMRNDLSRIAEIGSVRVPRLFEVETYPTFHTLTSTIEGRLPPGVGLARILGAMFPCGSVTGAPKIRAMEVIRALEAGPRGLYTGSLGWVLPNGAMRFNVAIRSALIDQAGRGQYGVGSGIVFDSDPAAEYEECLLKLKILADEAAPFGLIETMRWTPEAGIELLDRHRERLRRSAAFFGMTVPEAALDAGLAALTAGFGPEPQRVRLMLGAERHSESQIDLSAGPVTAPPPGPVRLALSPVVLPSLDVLRRHKTNRRAVYDAEYRRVRADDRADEVLFLNDLGELTEGSRTTLFVERDGVLWTPPLASGVLDGVLRRSLLDRPHPPVGERVLTLADLGTDGGAGRLFVGNAVWGLREAVLVAPP